jgi:hypothetical protein
MRASARSGIGILTLAVLGTAGCDVSSVLERLSEARTLAADLHVQFTKATDAGNRAVMADTDEASVAYAGDADEAKLAIQRDIDTLGPLLEALGYSEETQLLQEFSRRFAEYRELDRRLLDLAVENTNLKAQRLSFGAGQEAADSFRAALEAVTPPPPSNRWQVEALVARGVAAVREIQVLQAPHIAAADEAVMADLEQRIVATEAVARNVLTSLSPLVQPARRSHLGRAGDALDRFMAVHSQILALSRRNTNVRSLALSLNQKPALTAACEASLQALRGALAKRGFSGIRSRR